MAGVDEAGNPESLDYKSVGGTTLYTSSGSTTAGPIWGDAFKTIAPLIPDQDFTALPITAAGGELDSP